MTDASPELELEPLLMRLTAPPRGGKIGEWFFHGGRVDVPSSHSHGYPWYQVMWLTGVDYFSTLGYQPGIALLAAGALSPISSAFLVVVTLLGALPIYVQVASRSYAGQGSIAMLENLLSGWRAKIFVLILLGFASTDFVITMTLSAADAAQHAIENPFLHPYLADARVGLTLGMLGLLAFVFVMGFSEAIGVAAFVTIPYLLLNLLVIGRGAWEIAAHPELMRHWSLELSSHGDTTMLLIAAGLIFPKLALGMSGFETGVSVMPLITNQARKVPQKNLETTSPDSRLQAESKPQGRIRATRKMLASAALIMSFMLMGSSLVTAMLIPPADYAIGGPASGRAMAYLAHKLVGRGFGTIYDLSTIAILWFAGASAMAGMLSLIPRYLPRFGMAPRWVAYIRPLVMVLFIADVLVTLAFNASVEAQGGAYATGVLALMLSAAVAVAIALGRESKSESARSLPRAGLSWYFWLVAVIFVYVLVDNVIGRPDGVIIASIFIAIILVFSGISRYRRVMEFRVERMTFADKESMSLWPLLHGKKVNMVPMKINTEDAYERKRRELHQHYRIKGPIAFVHVRLLDNRSEFLSPLHLSIRPYGTDFAVEISGAIAVANSLAYLSEQLDPISLFLGLTRQNLMSQSLKYFLWGEGEVGLAVYTILIWYWEWTTEEDVRPLIFLISE